MRSLQCDERDGRGGILGGSRPKRQQYTVGNANAITLTTPTHNILRRVRAALLLFNEGNMASLLFQNVCSLRLLSRWTAVDQGPNELFMDVAPALNSDEGPDSDSDSDPQTCTASLTREEPTVEGLLSTCAYGRCRQLSNMFRSLRVSGRSTSGVPEPALSRR